MTTDTITIVTEVDKKNIENKTMVDVMLFKAIGLYQLLRPCESGSVRHRYRTIVHVTVWLMIGLQIMQVVRQYLSLGDIQLFLFTTVTVIVEQISNYKAYVLVTNTDKLWTVLEITRYGYISCSNRETSRLRRCGETISVWLRVFIVFIYITLTTWIIAPWIKNVYVPFNKLDGTIGHYRQTMLNMWYPISETVHNWTPVWALINLIETLISFTTVIWWVQFDCYLITVCTVLSAHFHNLSASYEILGRKSTEYSGKFKSFGTRPNIFFIILFKV